MLRVIAARLWSLPSGAHAWDIKIPPSQRRRQGGAASALAGGGRPVSSRPAHRGQAPLSRRVRRSDDPGGAQQPVALAVGLADRFGVRARRPGRYRRSSGRRARWQVAVLVHRLLLGFALRPCPERTPSSAAVRAGPEDLQGVADVGVAVLARRPRGSTSRPPGPRPRPSRRRSGRPGGGGGCRCSGGRPPRRPRCAARRPRRRRPAPAACGRPSRARRARRCGAAGRGSPGRCGSRRRSASARGDGLAAAGSGAEPAASGSVLVIVTSVGGVPVSVVDVVDVVAVLDRRVAAVRAVLVAVRLSARRCSCSGTGRRHGNGAAQPLAPAQPRRPTGQVGRETGQREQHDRGAGRHVGERRDATPAERGERCRATIARDHRDRKPRANCCAVATGTTISALTSSRPDRAHRDA